MKKQKYVLTSNQRELVEKNLSVVHWVILQNIHTHESIYGLGYEDLYQEGCIWLCHAAVTYEEKYALFSTYAKIVVRNGLFSYCRQLYAKEQHTSHLSLSEYEEYIPDALMPAATDTAEKQISLLETLDLLETSKRAYQGVARLGIEALELQIKGLSISDIAKLYDVPPSHVGAWISRSAQKLKKDKNFLSGIL
ncbi:MAG: sigma-70 family RNA polymerase sigma factor [Lachnospiraceae bacterium]|nr:sigma-70 family RNA polymerase sigma factor [Acetatifactor muris]MCM1220601.1 sigma-70 family RNA polymerase sigma factor [Lachnospiraceae bacterium]